MSGSRAAIAFAKGPSRSTQCSPRRRCAETFTRSLRCSTLCTKMYPRNASCAAAPTAPRNACTLCGLVPKALSSLLESRQHAVRMPPPRKGCSAAKLPCSARSGVTRHACDLQGAGERLSRDSDPFTQKSRNLMISDFHRTCSQIVYNAGGLPNNYTPGILDTLGAI